MEREEEECQDKDDWKCNVYVTMLSTHVLAISTVGDFVLLMMNSFIFVYSNYFTNVVGKNATNNHSLHLHGYLTRHGLAVRVFQDECLVDMFLTISLSQNKMFLNITFSEHTTQDILRHDFHSWFF